MGGKYELSACSELGIKFVNDKIAYSYKSKQLKIFNDLKPIKPVDLISAPNIDYVFQIKDDYILYTSLKFWKDVIKFDFNKAKVIYHYKLEQEVHLF